MAKKRRRWEKQAFNLSEHSRWKAKPGNVIFVADRGAVQFEVPREWVMKPNDDAICFYDDENEDDADIRLAVSVTHLSPWIDWSGLRIADMLEDVVIKDDKRGLTGRTPVTEIKRQGLEAVWAEGDFIDETEGRLAHSRMCIARCPTVQALITMEFWPEDRRRATRAWNDALETLKMGQVIENPFRGPLPDQEG